MSKFFYNRAATGICAKKPFIVIEWKILTTHKKVNKRPYWLVKNTPHFILWFEREHLIQLTDNCEWKAQNLRGKWFLIYIFCGLDCCGFGKFQVNNCVLYSPGWTNLKSAMKTEILPLNVNGQLVTFFLFSMNVFRPKFAAAGLPTNLHNKQQASFFQL